MTTILERVRTIRGKRVITRHSVEMLYAHEVDRLYRLKNGTAAQCAAAGAVPSRADSRSGRPCRLIASDDARRMWGPR